MAAVEFLSDPAAIGPVLPLAASALPAPIPESFEAMAGNVLASRDGPSPCPGRPDGVAGRSGGALLRVVRGHNLRVGRIVCRVTR